MNLATLSGVIFLLPVISYKARAWVKSCIWNEVVPSPPPKNGSTGRASFLDISIPSFASGALLATAVFLVIPEAIYLIQSYINEHAEEDPHAGHDDHRFLNETDPHDGEDGEEHDEHEGEILPDTIWRFGSALLGGFMLPMLFALFFPKASSDEHYAGDECEEVKPEAFEEDSDEEKANASPKKKGINYSLASSIVIGDALHNFCDGVFIGVALKGCDLAIVYTIVGVTLYHEIAQELADYFLLTKHVGLDPFRALVLNFLAGLSVMIGGLAVVASDINDMALGVLLALSSGVYLYIAACECLPRVTEVVKTRQNRLLSMFMFILGVVPIGLALLNHSHCEAEGHAEDKHGVDH